MCFIKIQENAWNQRQLLTCDLWYLLKVPLVIRLLRAIWDIPISQLQCHPISPITKVQTRHIPNDQEYRKAGLHSLTFPELKLYNNFSNSSTNNFSTKITNRSSNQTMATVPIFLMSTIFNIKSVAQIATRHQVLSLRYSITITTTTTLFKFLITFINDIITVLENLVNNIITASHTETWNLFDQLEWDN